MSGEKQHSREEIHRQEESLHYAKGIGSEGYRWWAYEHAEPPFDLQQQLVRALQLNGWETILELGSSTGSFLFDLRRQYAHQGRLIGVDPIYGYSHADDMPTELDDHLKLAAEYNELEFLYGKAQSIPVEDSSADVIVALFMFYHVPIEQQDQAMEEIKRAMKEDGKFALATSGANNKKSQRIYERLLAKYLTDKRIAEYLAENPNLDEEEIESARQSLEVKPPPIMNLAYNSDRAKDHLKKHFAKVRRVSQRSRMVFYNTEEAVAYLYSLHSMQDQFTPPPEDFWETILSVIAPIIKQEIEEKGYFEDTIERDFFICSQPMPTK